MQNNLTEIYSLLRFVAASVFKGNGVDAFIDAFKNIEKESADSDLRKLLRRVMYMPIQILQPFLLRRVKKEVEVDLPPKTEIILYTPLTGMHVCFS